MTKKIKKHIVFITLTLLALTITNLIPIKIIISLDNSVLTTEQELENLLSKTSKSFVKTNIISIKANNSENDKKLKEYSVNFRLFNLFNIKNLKVNVPEQSTVYSGGDCIGVSLKSQGVVIVGSNYIITKNGNQNPFKDSGLMIGDTIIKINNNIIYSVRDINKILSNTKSSKPLELTIIRKGKELKLNITPALDIQTKKHKLGVWVRDDALGVGTLTFVNKTNNRYGSLGHAIIDADTGTKFIVDSGEIFKCNVIGVKKGERGKPGELLGLFMQGEENKLGNVDKNNNNGVYGSFTNKNFLQNKTTYEIGGRLTAKPGKAKILSSINGMDIKEYDIEIIKTNHQSKANEKSMVIKITDPELIQKTGGIVQGMSGSPIIQNGKIIGAITHVFVNDPTKGFGLYLDWMIDE